MFLVTLIISTSTGCNKGYVCLVYADFGNRLVSLLFDFAMCPVFEF